MATATVLAIFLIPMLFVLVERWSGAERRRTEPEAASEPEPTKESAPEGEEKPNSSEWRTWSGRSVNP